MTHLYTLTEEQVLGLAKNVAQNLEPGAGWYATLVTKHECRYIYLRTLMDGLQLDVSEKWSSKGRVEFSLSIKSGLAKYEPYRDPCPSITVNPKRDPAKIARDIENRLLPAAREYFLNLLERKARTEDSNMGLAFNAKRIVDAGQGVCATTVSEDGGSFRISLSCEIPYEGDGVSFHGSVSERSVSFERVCLPLDLAEQFMGLIHQYQVAHPKAAAVEDFDDYDLADLERAEAIMELDAKRETGPEA